MITTEELPLNKLADFYRGVIFDKSDESRVPFSNSVPVLRAGNIQLELDTVNDLIYIPASVPSKEQIFRKGDIAICISSGSSHLVGKIAPLKTDFTGTIGGFCGIIRPKNELYGKFLKVWLKGPEFKQFRNADASGSNIQNLQFSNLPKIKIQLPKDLKKLESFLDDTSEKLTSVEQMHQAALHQKEAVEALQGALLREILLYKEGDELPKGWKLEKLSKVLKLKSGTTVAKEVEMIAGDLPYLRVSDMNLRGNEKYTLTSKTYVNKTKKIEGQIIPPHSVIFPKRGGAIATNKKRIVNDEILIDLNTMAAICDSSKLDVEFFYHWFSQIDLGELDGASSSVPQINNDDIYGLSICLPVNVTEQKQIATNFNSKFNKLNELKQQINAQLEAIEALPSAILREVFEFNTTKN